MGRIVVTEFMSLDGVMEDPGGAESFRHGGWSFRFERDDRGNKFKLDELLAADVLLLGRTTYLGFAKAWPTIEDPVGFAAKMNTMPKYVVSSTLGDDEATWANSTVLRGDVVAEATALKERFAGDILVEGSAQLVHTLSEHGLVDEYRLMVYPIVLGSGKRVFGDLADATVLNLDEIIPLSEGVLAVTYHPKGAPSEGAAAVEPSDRR